MITQQQKQKVLDILEEEGEFPYCKHESHMSKSAFLQTKFRLERQCDCVEDTRGTIDTIDNEYKKFLDSCCRFDELPSLLINRNPIILVDKRKAELTKMLERAVIDNA